LAALRLKSTKSIVILTGSLIVIEDDSYKSVTYLSAASVLNPILLFIFKVKVFKAGTALCSR
jgi:hypothetical protein